MSFLGLDLGTGGIRCLVVNERGVVLAEVARSLSRLNLSNKPGESEQDPNDWIMILEDALDELFSDYKNRDILAVAVDSTSGTVLPVAKNGSAVGPALLHNDMRSIKEVDLCKNIFGGECSPTFSLPKIFWMSTHLLLSDEVLFFHATDFLNSWLCGTTDIPTDFTNAMKSGFNLEEGKWSANISGVNLPDVVAPGKVIGEISTRLKKRWSLKGPCLLVSGATDSNAAFYASGACKIGDWSTTTGTTLAFKGVSSKRIVDSLNRIYCHRHPDGGWMPGGASNAGGEIVKDVFKDQINLVEQVCLKSSFIPAVIYPSIRKGERLPFSNPNFIPFGDRKSTSDPQYFLGCLEGLAFVEKMVYELLTELDAEVGDRIFATGGAASSLLGLKIRADVLQRSIMVPQYPNSAMGAAILASAGYYNKGVGQMSEGLVKISHTIEPGTHLDISRNERMDRFRDLCAQSNSNE